MYKKIIFIIIILLVVLGVIIIVGANKNSKNNKDDIINNDNTEIVVKDNPDGLQEPGGNIQQNNGLPNNAATVDDIVGKHPDMGRQPTNTEEMLKDKEIEIQK